MPRFLCAFFIIVWSGFGYAAETLKSGSAYPFLLTQLYQHFWTLL